MRRSIKNLSATISLALTQPVPPKPVQRSHLYDDYVQHDLNSGHDISQSFDSADNLGWIQMEVRLLQVW